MWNIIAEYDIDSPPINVEISEQRLPDGVDFPVRVRLVAANNERTEVETFLETTIPVPGGYLPYPPEHMSGEYDEWLLQVRNAYTSERDADTEDTVESDESSSNRQNVLVCERCEKRTIRTVNGYCAECDRLITVPVFGKKKLAKFLFATGAVSYFVAIALTIPGVFGLLPVAFILAAMVQMITAIVLLTRTEPGADSHRPEYQTTDAREAYRGSFEAPPPDAGPAFPDSIDRELEREKERETA